MMRINLFVSDLKNGLFQDDFKYQRIEWVNKASHAVKRNQDLEAFVYKLHNVGR